jgi:hypothetical protein
MNSANVARTGAPNLKSEPPQPPAVAEVVIEQFIVCYVRLRFRLGKFPKFVVGQGTFLFAG